MKLTFIKRAKFPGGVTKVERHFGVFEHDGGKKLLVALITSNIKR